MHNNPFRDDPFQDDGHLLAPGHPFRDLSGLIVSCVSVFFYRAPQGRPLDYFHPGKHHHRFTPSPYRHVCIPGDPQLEFFTDTRIPAEPCPWWAFASAEGTNLDNFYLFHYLWHRGVTRAAGAPRAKPASGQSDEAACLLDAFFTALRQFPAEWTPSPPWNYFHSFSKDEMEQI